MNIFIGLLLGFIGSTFLFIFMMRNFMISKKKVNKSFNETCKIMYEKVLGTNGWSFPIETWDMYTSQVKNNLFYENIKNLKIFFVCKAEYANKILQKFPEMSGIMPCSWAVFEENDGNVYISKMNIPLMSKMFFGNIIGKIMGKVGKEEKDLMNYLEN